MIISNCSKKQVYNIQTIPLHNLTIYNSPLCNAIDTHGLVYCMLQYKEKSNKDDEDKRLLIEFYKHSQQSRDNN